MTLPLHTHPDPILLGPCAKVGEFNSELADLVRAMRTTMHRAKGVGLAAPQVGKSIKLAVLEYQPDADDNEEPVPFQVLVNPKVISTSDDEESLSEGCLSLPGIEVEVSRPYRIKVRAQNELGESIQFRASGFYARIIQHEIDHLNGRLIVDYAKNREALLRTIKKT